MRADLHRVCRRVPVGRHGGRAGDVHHQNANCADICTATGAVLSRQTTVDVEVVRAVVEACRTACAACAQECEQHADMHEHCRVCAEACRRCEQACNDLLAAL